MAHPTTEQVRAAAETAIRDALAVTPGEYLAEIGEGENWQEPGFKIRNNNGEFEVMTWDENAEEPEKFHKFRVTVEIVG